MKKYLLSYLLITLVLFFSEVFTVSAQTPEQIIDQSAGDPQAVSVSCPVPGGRIGTYSHQVGTQLGTGGHCTPGFYGFSCNCGTEGRRAKAIDVYTGGQGVILPQIGNRNVEWKLTTRNYSVDGSEGGGLGNTFEAVAGPDTWYLDMLHLQPTSLQTGQSYLSGTEVATSVGAHVHTTIGKNLSRTPSAGSETDCDPGWMPSDFMCDPSQLPAGATQKVGLGTQSKKSNMACVKVGNPTDPDPCTIAAAGGGTRAPVCTVGPNGEEICETVRSAPSVETAALSETISNEFGVNMQGGWSERGLRRVYEAFYQWQQTNPKFIQLIKGQTVVWIPNPDEANAFGNVAKVGDSYDDGQKFLGTLVHEMSHVTYHTKPIELNFRYEADGLFRNPGVVTSYGASNSDGSENYPEMLSYCLTGRPVGDLISQERWVQYYKPLAEKITGGPCPR